MLLAIEFQLPLLSDDYACNKERMFLASCGVLMQLWGMQCFSLSIDASRLYSFALVAYKLWCDAYLFPIYIK